MPDKHIRLSESILGLAAFLLQALTEPKTLDALWNDVQQAHASGVFPAHHGIDNVAVAVSFLYAIGGVKDNGNGAIARCA